MTGDELLKEYAEHFNEAFPLYSFPNDEEKIIKTIKRCLETDTLYENEYEDDVVY